MSKDKEINDLILEDQVCFLEEDDYVKVGDRTWTKNKNNTWESIIILQIREDSACQVHRYYVESYNRQYWTSWVEGKKGK